MKNHQALHPSPCHWKNDGGHEEVINHYLRKINDLMNSFECYFGGTNEIGRLAVGMIAWVADCPESQNINAKQKEGKWERCHDMLQASMIRICLSV